jgi:hypothetical protein
VRVRRGRLEAISTLVGSWVTRQAQWRLLLMCGYRNKQFLLVSAMANCCTSSSSSSSDILPYDCYFEYLSKYDPDVIQFLLFLRQEILLQQRTIPRMIHQPLLIKKVVLTKLNYISDIPLECLLQIFSYLDSQSLCRSQCVCVEWHHPASLDWLWKDLCFISFQSSPDQFRFQKSMTMKEVYSSMHLVMHRTLHPPKPQSFTNFSIPAFLLSQF